jgi:hypothetical protein
VTDHADEGGDPACWAHLFDDDAYGGVDLAHHLAVGSPSAAGSGSPDGQACGGEVAVDAKERGALVDDQGAEVSFPAVGAARGRDLGVDP